MRSLLTSLLLTSSLFVSLTARSVQSQVVPPAETCARSQPNFLVFGGGGAPAYNEIAIEKNVLYFQRTLQTLGFNPANASIFFANGNDGRATIRYLDRQNQQKFKVPEIPHLKGAATLENLQRWLGQATRQSSAAPLFFYFTGHGQVNRQNVDNNVLMLWNDKALSVQQFSQMLDRLPNKMPVVTMMAQCYSGAFANLIYQGGNPNRPVALQTRCGFFATIKTRPSVGCTPAVNEADYRDYSSSFFAGLSGRDRLGKPVASADYNRDGRIAYTEAHAFAKIDEVTTDLPISTSESWLQRQVGSKQQRDAILARPIATLIKTARPEQRYVITALNQKFNLDPRKSFLVNLRQLDDAKLRREENQAYIGRLGMELVNIAVEQRIRASGNQQAIATLNRLLKCESGSW